MSRTTLAAAILFAGAVACTPSMLEPLPLDIELQASRTTAAPGDTVLFVADAQGGNLVGLQIDYGDTNSDLFSTAGARTARVTFRHAYLERGTFTVRVTVTDAAAGIKEATTEVRVN